jgi:hypothetical protein
MPQQRRARQGQEPDLYLYQGESPSAILPFTDVDLESLSLVILEILEAPGCMCAPICVRFNSRAAINAAV